MFEDGHEIVKKIKEDRETQERLWARRAAYMRKHRLQPISEPGFAPQYDERQDVVINKYKESLNDSSS